MKSVKISSAEPAKDISAMKGQLSAVLKEMSAFSARIDDLKAQELCHGFAPSFSNEQRLQELRSKLQPGKDPAKPVIFLVRMVIECLSRGPMSEKDIKNVVLERCRELDIKVSSRGLIAGTGMDVATVCSVLAALGVLEQIDAATVAGTKGDPSTGIEASAVPTTVSGMPAGAQVKVEGQEGGCGCPESITGPGAELYALLTERWQPRLLEYYDDAQKSKAAAVAAAAASVAAVDAKSVPGLSDASVVGAAGVTAVPGSTATTAPPTPSGATLPVPLPSPSRLPKAAPPSGASTVPAAASAVAPTSAPSAPLYPIFNSSLSASTGRTATTSTAPSAGSTAASTAVPAPASAASTVPSAARATAPPITAPAQLARAELTAVSALVGLDSQATPAVATIAASVGSSITGAAIPPTPLAQNSASAAAGLRPSLSTGMISDPGSSGSYQPVRSANSVPAAPTSFLSTSGAPGHGPSSSSVLPTPVPPVQIVPPYTPAQPGPGLPTEVTYTSILSASGTSITIPGPGAAVESSSAKPTKSKTPKVPKQPGERKQTKRPVSKGSDLALALSGASTGSAAGTVPSGGSGAAVAGGSVVGEKAKTRRGPTALRVWRIREEVLPHTTELLALAPLGAPSAPSSSTAGAAYASTSAPAVDTTAPAVAGNPVGPGFNSNTTTSTLRNTIAPDNGIATNSTTNGSSGSVTEGNPALRLLTQPGIMQSAARADYTLQTALEMEERLLRRLAGQCNIPLKPSRYRLGTAYLSADPEGAMTQVISSRYARGSGAQQVPAYFSKTTKKVAAASDAQGNDDYLRDTSSAVSNTAAEPSFALYDEGVAMTSAYLLDKVRRTKRQRGDCLYGTITLPYSGTATASVVAARSAAAASVGVYSATHVHALSAVCAKTQEYYWGAGTSGQGNSSPRGQGKGAKKPVPAASKGQNEPITVAQYAHNLYMGISTGGASVVLSSANNGGSITSQTLRRYAQPLSLVGGNLPMLDPTKSADIFAASASKSGSEVLRIPDLTLHTREIAWSEIANEFSVLPAPVDEPGSIALPGSASTASLLSGPGKDTTQDTGPNKAGISKKPPTEKKRKYLQNHGPPPAPVSATLQDAAQRLASIEVLAPQYQEIVPACEVVRQMQASGQTASVSSDSEDTSDEAVEAKHEAVLQRMRDKWNLLQQLKAEALYGPGGVPPVGMDGKAGGGYRGGGYGGYFGGRTTGGAFASAATLPAGSSGGLDDSAGLPGLQVGLPNGAGRFLNLSPRKRGLASAHAKRRGRPPKIAKLAHHFHAQYPTAVGGGTGPSGPDPAGQSPQGRPSEAAGSQAATSGPATEASNQGGSSSGSAAGNNSDGGGSASADESGL